MRGPPQQQQTTKITTNTAAATATTTTTSSSSSSSSSSNLWLTTQWFTPPSNQQRSFCHWSELGSLGLGKVSKNIIYLPSLEKFVHNSPQGPLFVSWWGDHRHNIHRKGTHNRVVEAQFSAVLLLQRWWPLPTSSSRISPHSHWIYEVRKLTNANHQDATSI